MENRSHDQEDGFTDQSDRNLDRGWAWVILISALVTHILTFGVAYASVGALYVELLTEFKQSEAATSWTGSIILGVMLCSGPLSGVLVGNYGAMIVAIIGGALSVSGLVLSSFATSLFHLYLTFGVITGLGFGMSYLPCIVMLGKFFDRRRAIACGLAVSGSGMGTFIFAPIIQYLIGLVGWRRTFLILGIVEILLCVCGATYMKEKIPKRLPKQKNEEETNNQIKSKRSVTSLSIATWDITSVIAESVEQISTQHNVWDALSKTDDMDTVSLSSCQYEKNCDVDDINYSNNAICDGEHCEEMYTSITESGDINDIMITIGSVQKDDNRQIDVIDKPPNTDPLSDSYHSTDGLMKTPIRSTRFRLSNHLGFLLTFGHLFKNLFFVLFCISNFFMCVGYQLPYVYFKAFAMSLGIAESDWYLVLSVMGVTDMLGRIVVGFLFNPIKTNQGKLYGYLGSVVISGLLLFSVSFARGYGSLISIAALYALVAGSTDSLVPSLLVGYIGMDKLSYSFGMVIEMQGVGFLVGPPIAGVLFGVYSDYRVVFYTGGLAFVLAGTLFVVYPLLNRKWKS